MKAAIRTVAAIVLGMLTAIVLIVALELIEPIVYPPPPGFDSNSPEQMRDYVALTPQWFLVVGVILWALTACVSTWLARKIGNRYASIVVGLLLMAMLVLNIALAPYPAWFKVAVLVAIPLAIVAGGRLAIGRKSPV
jgi:hypothetical protein